MVRKYIWLNLFNVSLRSVGEQPCVRLRGGQCFSHQKIPSYLLLGEDLLLGIYPCRSMISANTQIFFRLSGKTEKMVFFPPKLLQVKAFPHITGKIYNIKNFLLRVNEKDFVCQNTTF